MGLQFRRRVHLTPDSWLNVSKSGVSASKRVGRITVNSKGKMYVRLPFGLIWRGKI